MPGYPQVGRRSEGHRSGSGRTNSDSLAEVLHTEPAEAGLVTRTPSTADRRVILVTLTAEGVRVSARAIEAFLVALRERAVAPLGEDGFARLADSVAGLDPGGAERQCPGAAGDGNTC